MTIIFFKEEECVCVCVYYSVGLEIKAVKFEPVL